jgi:hypothetical protein
MAADFEDDMARAFSLWASGEPLEAGKIIFDRLAPDKRPEWAARVLKLVIDKSGVRTGPFDTVIHAASQRSLWGDGHRIFSELRTAVLRLDRLERLGLLSKKQMQFREILGLAELVAKVTYNASQPRGEFDSDSGWWIACGLRWFVDLWSEDDFTKLAWASLSTLPGGEKGDLTERPEVKRD